MVPFWLPQQISSRSFSGVSPSIWAAVTPVAAKHLYKPARFGNTGGEQNRRPALRVEQPPVLQHRAKYLRALEQEPVTDHDVRELAVAAAKFLASQESHFLPLANALALLAVAPQRGQFRRVGAADDQQSGVAELADRAGDDKLLPAFPHVDRRRCEAESRRAGGQVGVENPIIFAS